MTYKKLSPQEVHEKLGKEKSFKGYCLENNNYKSVTFLSVNLTGIYPYFYVNGKFGYTECVWVNDCYVSNPDTYEPYPEDEMPDLKRLDGVMSKSGAELTVLTVFKQKNDNRHLYLSNALWVTNKDLFEHYTHLDGSPIGRKVEC